MPVSALTRASLRSATGFGAPLSTAETLLWTGQGNLVTWNPGSLLPRESYIAGFCMGNGNEAVALHTRVAERKMVQ